MSIDIDGKKFNYDQTANSYYYLILIGLTIAFFTYSSINPFTSIEAYGNINLETEIKGFWLRISAVILVIYFAHSQNRTRAIYAISAFIFPSITLIVMGFLKKKTYPTNYDTFSDDKKSKINRVYAFKLYQNDKLDLALEYIKRAISLDESNANNYCIIGIIQAYQGEAGNGLNMLKTSLAIGNINDELYIERGMAFMKHNRKDLALEDFKAAINIHERIVEKLHKNKIVYQKDANDYKYQIRKVKEFVDQEISQ